MVDGVSQKWYNYGMKKKESIIYKGEYYTVEWFYDDDGYSQPYEFFLKSSDVAKRKFLMLVKRIADFGRIVDKTKFRNEGDDIYAFKPQPERYLCFFVIGKRIIVTNAFQKKSNKLPQSEKDIAMKNRAVFYERKQKKKEEKK